jgi:hypothetical protein
MVVLYPLRKLLLISIILSLCFAPSVIFAGDIPESIMTGKNQKGLLIGLIKRMGPGQFMTVSPIKILMGSAPEDDFQANRITRYYGTSTVPRAGDYIVAVLLDDGKIDESWVFKSTSGNYRTLKLESEPYDIVQRYESYITEGKYIEAQIKIDSGGNTAEPAKTAYWLYVLSGALLAGIAYAILKQK